PLHRVYETSCPEPATADCEQIAVTDLQQSAQMRVHEGFEESTSLEKAREDISRLRFEQMLPPCPPASEPQPTPTETVAPPPNGEGGLVEPPEQTLPPTTAGTMPPVPGKDCRQVG